MMTLKHILQRLLRSLPAKAMASLFVFYLLFGYFAVNPLAQWLLPWIAEHQLDSRASVAEVTFDPLRLQLHVRQLKLTTAQGALLASLEALDTDLNSNGLWQWAWKLDHIALQQPHIRLQISPQGKLNWDALLAKLNEDPSPPSDSLPRVVIEQLAISGGKLDYEDNQHGTTSALALTPLNFSLSGFSTLPEDRGDYLLAVALPDHGGTLKWKGDISVNPLASKGRLSINQLALPPLLDLLPPSAQALQLTQGQLQGQFDYQFAIQHQQPALALSQLQLAVHQLHGTHTTYGQFELEQASLRLPTLHLNMQSGLQIDLQDIALESLPLQLHKADTSLKLASINITLPALSLQAQQGFMPDFHDLDLRLQSLEVMHQNHALLTLPALNVHQIALTPDSQQLHIGQIELLNGKLSATRMRSGAIDWAQAISVFAPAPQDLIQAAEDKHTGSANSDPAQPATAQSVTEHSTAPETAAALQFEIADIQLEKWQLAYHDQTFKQPLSIQANEASASLAFQHGKQLSALQNIALKLARISATSAGAQVATLAGVSLKEGHIALDQQKIQAAALTLSGLHGSLIRNADGSLNLQQVFASAAPVSHTSRPVPQQSANKTARNWTLALQTLALNQSGLHIEDRSTPQAVMLDLQHMQAEIKHPSLNLKQALPVKASFAIQQGGRFELKGTVTPAPLNAQLQLALHETALAPFSPLLNQHATLNLAQGNLSLSGKLTIAAPQSVRFAGGFDLRQLSIIEDTPEGNPFLQWSSLASDSVSLSLAPNQLSITTLTLNNPQGKFIIHPDRTLNVTRVLRPPQTATTISTANTAPASTPATEGTPSSTPATESGFPVNIDNLRINQADLTFADLSLTPQFGTDIHDLGGVINGISSRSDAVAQVELDGKVDEYGSARLRGQLTPFQATQQMDLRLIFSNLEMSRLTPYSGKFAGRKIESGKLSVDLQYNIKQRKLDAKNQFVIHKLKLGQRVDSKDAADLPLDLAIAILEDREGVIDLNLPVKGSLDDPQFSYSAIAWKAFKNILVKIVTAPFAILGNLFGGHGDKLDHILFEAGSASITPPELEKLHQLSAGLNQRPQLHLNITASYDSIADRHALQVQALREQVATALKQAPGPIDTSNPKVQDVLQSMHDRLTKKPLLKRLASKFEKPKDGHFEQLQQALTDSMEVGDDALMALATQRAEAITQTLIAKQVSASRISSGKTTSLKSGEENVKTSLSLSSGR